MSDVKRKQTDILLIGPLSINFNRNWTGKRSFKLRGGFTFCLLMRRWSVAVWNWHWKSWLFEWRPAKRKEPTHD